MCILYLSVVFFAKSVLANLINYLVLDTGRVETLDYYENLTNAQFVPTLPVSCRHVTNQ